MSRIPSPFPLLLVAVAATLAAPTPEASAQSPPETPTVEAFTEAWVIAVRAWDVDAWSELVTDDVVMMASHGRTYEGRQAFHDLWTRAFKGRSGPNPLKVTVVEERAHDDVVIVRADYGPIESSEPVGQYVWVLERKDAGSWRLDWWIFNRVPGER